MSLPKEPRQLMINLMYLVLTALLALNVSTEVLNAFNIVDNSIKNSNDNIESKNKSTMVNFDKVQDDPKLEAKKRAKVEQAQSIAEQGREITKQMIADLDVYRDEIVKRSDGYDPETNKLIRESDLDIPTKYMIKEGNGQQMLAKLTKYKIDIANLIEDLPEEMQLYNEKGEFEKKLPLNVDPEPEPGKTWEYYLFNMVPSVAAVTIIDKFKNDVKNSESAVLDELWASAMGEKKMQKTVPNRVFNKYGVIASLDNSYVLPGQAINVNAMLGAYNADSKGLEIYVNGARVGTKNGIADKRISASSTPGKHTVKVRARYLDKGSNDEDVQVWKTVPEQTINYFVGQPQATISLDKMKILYKGLENPLTVSASGVQLGDISVTAGPNIKLVKKGPGKFHALATKNSGKSWIRITGKRSDGSIEDFGKQEYRLGRVPDPISEVAGMQTGSMPVNRMRAQQGVFAKLKGFPYDLKYTVTSYTLVHVPKRGEMPAPVVCNSQFLFSASRGVSGIQAIGKNLKVGDRLFFENIKAVGPDGETRKLGGLSFTFPN